MNLPRVIHAEPATPRRDYGTWRAEPTSDSTLYIPAADLEAAFIEGAKVGMAFVNLDPENRERAMVLIQGRAQSYSRR
jgi:uncharacterized protein YdeI (YjbR/CyaY-like superfamily)